MNIIFISIQCHTCPSFYICLFMHPIDWEVILWLKSFQTIYCVLCISEPIYRSISYLTSVYSYEIFVRKQITTCVMKG